MTELLALFRFLVPLLAAVPDDLVIQALELAAAERPACLTAGKQDEAQVYYAAWILYGRQLQTQATEQAPIPLGVKSEKEGDLQRTYGIVEGAADPFDYWGRFVRLAKLCGGAGAITVGHRCGGRLWADYADAPQLP